MFDTNFPLIDLHRHLDGSIRLDTILDIGRKHNLPLPAWSRETLKPYVQIMEPQPGVMAFLSKFEWMVGILVDQEACFRVAYENVEDAKNEGIDYIELRFSPRFMAESHQLNMGGVVEAVIKGARKGEYDFGVKINLIGIISRTYGPEAGWGELDAILRHRDKFIALDLAGDEANFPGDLFTRHFSKARDAGLHVTIHAGESAGVGSIWQAVKDLGAERLGHAVNAQNDTNLMDFLARQKIGVESNLTSNVQTSVVQNYISHPLKKFLENGILATINTDDPGISAIDLPHEYNVAAISAGLSPTQIKQAQHNALDIAFLSQEEKNDLVTKKKEKTPGEG